MPRGRKPGSANKEKQEIKAEEVISKPEIKDVPTQKDKDDPDLIVEFRMEPEKMQKVEYWMARHHFPAGWKRELRDILK